MFETDGSKKKKKKRGGEEIKKCVKQIDCSVSTVDENSSRTMRTAVNMNIW